MARQNPYVMDSPVCKADIVPGVSIFGVFDGHNGKKAADFAKKHFIPQLLVNTAFRNKDYSTALTENFLRMDEMMLLHNSIVCKMQSNASTDNNGNANETDETIKILKADLSDDQDLYKMEIGNDGCTICVALLAHDELYVANAGDCRCVLYSADSVTALSTDHKPSHPEEEKRIIKAGYKVDHHEDRVGGMNLSRALGDFFLKNKEGLGPAEYPLTAVPEIVKRKLTAKDQMLVVACDGIWDCATNEQVGEMLLEKVKNEEQLASKAVEELFDKIIVPKEKMVESSKIGRDNMTCIVVSFAKLFASKELDKVKEQE